MPYITFFQFLRRCFLRDAERYTVPEQVLEHVESVLCESEPERTAQANKTEQTAGAGGCQGRVDKNSVERYHEGNRQNDAN